MTDRTRSLLVLLPWLPVPALSAGLVATWQRLPPRLAVHFDGGGAPDGWMSRWQFAAFAVGVLVFVLANFTWKLLSGARRRKVQREASVLLRRDGARAVGLRGRPQIQLLTRTRAAATRFHTCSDSTPPSRSCS